MEILPFGTIDPKKAESYYSSSISVSDTPVDIDLNFESEIIHEEALLELKTFLTQIPEMASRAWDTISADWDLNEESETARFYLQHHLDEFNKDDILALFGTTNIDKQTFMKALSLTRIGFYPEDEDMFAVFDIQLPSDLTDYLISVTFSPYGDVTGMTMES